MRPSWWRSSSSHGPPVHVTPIPKKKCADKKICFIAGPSSNRYTYPTHPSPKKTAKEKNGEGPHRHRLSDQTLLFLECWILGFRV